MPWVKIPPENHPKFQSALPEGERVQIVKMFGGVAAKVNGHVFAGLFGRSTMVLLDEADRQEALALDGASMFDPMGDGRRRSDKVMLPERVMDSPVELRGWIGKAFRAAARLPEKGAKAAVGRKPPPRSASPKKLSAEGKPRSKR